MNNVNEIQRSYRRPTNEVRKRKDQRIEKEDAAECRKPHVNFQVNSVVLEESSVKARDEWKKIYTIIDVLKASKRKDDTSYSVPLMLKAMDAKRHKGNVLAMRHKERAEDAWNFVAPLSTKFSFKQATFRIIANMR